MVLTISRRNYEPRGPIEHGVAVPDNGQLWKGFDQT